MEMTLPREAGEMVHQRTERRAVFCNVRNLGKGSGMYKVCHRIMCTLAMSVHSKNCWYDEGNH